MQTDLPMIDVIILAAGLSRRMGASRKQYLDIGGVPVYQRAIESFATHRAVLRIVLVVPQDDVSALQQAHQNEALIITHGGAERHDSVACGLAALGQDIGLGQTAGQRAPYIAIHDAARPFVPASIIDAALSALKNGAKAVIPVLPVADTIKQVRSGDERVIAHTLERAALRRVQTPQIFEADIITALHAKADYGAASLTDDASLAEAAGIAVTTIDGDEQLAKLTWASDLTHMKAALMKYDTRTGTGFDVHRFCDGTGPIMICGLGVDHDKALDAHSDGDVGIHALCDAIFGALCDGDIGMHFPPSDERWRDASSDQFLTYAVDKIAQAGGRLVHVDVTILCEMPKIGPHRDAMRTVLAGLCGLPLSSVSVKATTTERLGFTGRGEGIAAQAAATIEIPSPLHNSQT